jgi:hypothetical protein
MSPGTREALRRHLRQRGAPDHEVCIQPHELLADLAEVSERLASALNVLELSAVDLRRGTSASAIYDPPSHTGVLSSRLVELLVRDGNRSDFGPAASSAQFLADLLGVGAVTPEVLFLAAIDNDLSGWIQVSRSATIDALSSKFQIPWAYAAAWYWRRANVRWLWMEDDSGWDDLRCRWCGEIDMTHPPRCRRLRDVLDDFDCRCSVIVRQNAAGEQR